MSKVEEIKADIREFLEKKIKGKRNSISKMKDLAYSRFKAKLPKWIPSFVIDWCEGYVRNKINALFVEALANVKHNKSSDIQE